MSETRTGTPKGLFITGVDTGVGKTVVAASLLIALYGETFNVRPKKPVESACESGPEGLIPADALKLWEAAGRPGTLSQVCKYAYAPLAAPDRAARLSGESLAIENLAQFCFEDLDDGDVVLVEGAGGFYSPIAEDGLNADLAAALGLPVVIVAFDKLGCINQILLTAEAVANRGLTVAAVVLNVHPGPPEGDLDNAADLESHLDAPVFRFMGKESAGFLELLQYLLPRLMP